MSARTQAAIDSGRQSVVGVNRYKPDGAEEIIVHHLGDTAPVQPLLAAVKKRFPARDIGLYPLGPVLGVHLGSNTLGVAWIGAE